MKINIYSIKGDVVEKMDADEHFKTAKKIASDNMASPNYTCSTLLEDEHDHSIKSYIIDLLIKENESTFWSCKLAIIEKEQKQKKLINANQILLEKILVEIIIMHLNWQRNILI